MRLPKNPYAGYFTSPQFLKRRAERDSLREQGLDWPPLPWQRVELLERLRYDPATGPVLGVMLGRDGSYFYVISDHEPADNSYSRECYDSELRPVLDGGSPGWVPLRFWRAHLASLHDPAGTYDLRLHDGTLVSGCFTKPVGGSAYYFAQVGLPYQRVLPIQIDALRPHQPA